jgi:hypothetical protein
MQQQPGLFARVFGLMTIRHGTRYRYSKGCRCDDCAEAARLYQRDYRLRKPGDPVAAAEPGPGPVEIGVSEEIDGLAAQARPGLAQAALAMARILDNPKSANQPAAAKVLISMLERLRSASPAGRRGLAVVREMTKKDGA